MPTPVAAGEIVQVLPQFLIESQQGQNVWYFRARTPDVDMVANLLQVVGQCILTTLIPVLHPNFVMEQVVGKVVTPALGAADLWIPEPTDDVSGNATGDALPSYASALISLHTTRGGREGRGRTYIAGVAEGHTIGSYINREAALWAALLAFSACMLENFKVTELNQDAKYEWGVMSRKIGGLKPPFLSSGFAPITRAVPDVELATTRSRKQRKRR